MLNHKKLLTVLAVIGLSSPALSFAASASELAKLNEETQVINAKISKAEAEIKLAEKTKTLVNNYADYTVPVIRSIDGADGKLKANLAVGNGITKFVVKGDKVGIYQVMKIELDSVYIKRATDNELIKLSFGMEPVKQDMPLPLPMPSVR